MNSALVPLAVAAALAVALLLARSARAGAGGAFLATALAAAAGLAVALPLFDRPPHVDEADVTGRPIRVEDRGYISSTACRACHAHEYDTWHASYHRQMTQIAEPAAVIGDFDDVTLERHGQTFELTRADDGLWIELDDPLAQRAGRVRRRVSMTTGAHHMQLYWYESGHTRVLGLLPFAFLRGEERWIPRLAAFLRPPSEEISPELGRGT